MNTSDILYKYKNGNATITIKEDGSRTVQYKNALNLEYPLNVDIRVMSKCPFGYNPQTQTTTCLFCHESATTDGKEAEYTTLLNHLSELPKGTELAIGLNDITDDVYLFLQSCNKNGWIANVTVNEYLLTSKPYKVGVLLSLISDGTIKGIGISYRNDIKKHMRNVISPLIEEYSNTVYHTIAGIDDIADVIKLHETGIKKVLVLGEKDFGFNKNKVDTTSYKHKLWRDHIMLLPKLFDVVSFDNLAIEQLDIKSKIPQNEWSTFYQGEYSLYIDAVRGQYRRNSRTNDNTVNWEDVSLKDYFQQFVMSGEK